MKKNIFLVPTIFLFSFSAIYAAESYNPNQKLFKEFYQDKDISKTDQKKKIIVKRKKKLTEKKIIEEKSIEGEFHTFLGAQGLYYAGLEFGKTYLSRAVILNSKNTGEVLYRSDNGNELGPADGTKYNFNQSLEYTRLSMIAGFQERKTGDFYQVSYYMNDLVQDVLFTLGYSYKKFGYQYMLGSTPFIKIDGGFGHTGTSNGLPTNYTLGIGIGAYKNVMNFQIKAGFAYQKRNWLYLEKDIGTEKWEDSETTLYGGISYLF